MQSAPPKKWKVKRHVAPPGNWFSDALQAITKIPVLVLMQKKEIKVSSVRTDKTREHHMYSNLKL